MLNWDSERAALIEAVELGEEAAAAAAAAAAVTVDVVDEASEVEEEADGEFFASCPEEEADRLAFGFLPAMARASVMLLEMVIPLACCCCFSWSKLFAELDAENFSNELAVNDPDSPDFLATFVSSEQLLKEAEFLTCVDLLILSGTVHVALNEADR